MALRSNISVDNNFTTLTLLQQVRGIMDRNNSRRRGRKGYALSNVRQIHTFVTRVMQEVQTSHATHRTATNSANLLLVGMLPYKVIIA